MGCGGNWWQQVVRAGDDVYLGEEEEVGGVGGIVGVFKYMQYFFSEPFF